MTEADVSPAKVETTARLTIAIPSYNRNVTLEKNLALLLPQLTRDCVLTILDNASDTPLSDTLQDLKHFEGCAATIVRNRVNIGANANLVRCLETCCTEWLWILGDDDPVKPDAVATIMGQINSAPECIFINFRSELCPERDVARTGRGISEFAQQLDSFSNALFISTSVFNAGALLPRVSFGYQFAYSCAPHLAVLFAAMKEERSWCFSPEQIVDVVLAKNADQKWSPLTPALGKMTLLELPMSHSARRALARKLSSRPKPEYLVISLVLLASRNKSSQEALYLYQQLCSRLYAFDSSFGGHFRRWFGRRLITNWTFSVWMANTLKNRFTAPRWAGYRSMLDQAGVDQWHRLL